MALMNPLYNVISDLLFQYDAVTLPGVGKFLCDHQGAKVNVITNEFERPTVTVTFDPDDKASDDLMMQYLCEQRQVPKAQAESEWETFLADIRSTLEEGGEVDFPEVGILSLRPDGTLSFTPADVSIDQGDTFGLGDFTPTPVFTTEPQDDWKLRIAEQQRDKNTKMTVDKDVMYVENEEELAEMRRRRKRKTRRAVLFSLLGVLVVLACLIYLKIIDIEFIKKYFQPQPEPPVVVKSDFHPNPELLREMVVYYPSPVADSCAKATIDTSMTVAETGISEEVLSTVPEKPTTIPENTSIVPENPSASGWDESYAPPATSKFFIVGGFFSEKQNALNLAQSMFDEGYPHAFIYPAGSKYYTCYGHYETKEEAKQALETVKANTNAKAWLFERKR